MVDTNRMRELLRRRLWSLLDDHSRKVERVLSSKMDNRLCDHTLERLEDQLDQQLSDNNKAQLEKDINAVNTWFLPTA